MFFNIIFAAGVVAALAYIIICFIFRNDNNETV